MMNRLLPSFAVKVGSTSVHRDLRVADPIPYSKEALKQNLLRVRNAWEDCQASRDRNAM